MIELTQIGYRVGGRWALREISLSVPEGEVFGLAGPNGGGKSLLLAICATVVPMHTGRGSIGGEDVRSRASAVRRLIGYVPDVVGMNPQMTVREDLEIFANAHGMSRESCRDATAEALERWGLRMVAGDAMGAVSRGFLHRVALARAMLHRPRALLLDDPASGLDSDAREILQGELRRHVENGGSALMASHRLPELSRWSHRIGFLVAGELREVVDSRSVREASPDDTGAAASLTARELS